MENLQRIYLDQITLVLKRLAASENFLNEYNARQELPFLESAILQMRKAMECFAFAAVAPNKNAYVNYRKNAENSNYTKDFNATKICKYLSNINSDFYPNPVEEPVSTGPGHWHIGRPSRHPLPREKFEIFYDRLGKFLHSDNPWGADKGVTNLSTDLPGIISNLRVLLAWHFTVIKTSEFSGIWVVKALSDGSPPTVITGQADRDFVVNKL